MEWWSEYLLVNLILLYVLHRLAAKASQNLITGEPEFHFNSGIGCGFAAVLMMIIDIIISGVACLLLDRGFPRPNAFLDMPTTPGVWDAPTKLMVTGMACAIAAAVIVAIHWSKADSRNTQLIEAKYTGRPRLGISS